MPIVVDHDAQRENVTAIAGQLVAREGVAALTFRRVAEAAGSSTAIVSTYFTGKQDLLLATLRAAATRTTVRFEAAAAAGGGLQESLEMWLPLDQDRLTDWRVIIAYWGVAVTDPELARIQDGHVGRARERVNALLPRRNSALAGQIVALTLGIAVQGAFAPGGTTARAQRALLAGGLARLLDAPA